jgi:hypothetical protein
MLWKETSALRRNYMEMSLLAAASAALRCGACLTPLSIALPFLMSDSGFDEDALDIRLGVADEF